MTARGDRKGAGSKCLQLYENGRESVRQHVAMPRRAIILNRPRGNSLARSTCGERIVPEAVHPTLKDGPQFFLWRWFVV